MKKARFFLLIPLSIFGVFFYLPLILLFKDLFFGGEELLPLFSDFIFESGNITIIKFTIKQAFLSTFFSFLIGFPAAYFVSHYKFKGKDFLETISFFPFVIPSILVALGFILFWGKYGWFNQFLDFFNFKKIKLLYTLKIIIIAHSFYNFPIIMKIVGERWKHLDKKIFESANLLGANIFQRFYYIFLPAMLPAIFQACIIVFVYCFMSFGIMLVLGSVRFSTIEVSLYMLIHNIRDYNSGLLLAFIQLSFTSLLLFLSIFIEGYFKKTNDFFCVVKDNYVKSNIKIKIVLILFWIILFFLLVAPIMSVLISGFVQNRRGEYFSNISQIISILSNNYDPLLGVRPLTAIFTSLFLAVTTGVFVNVLAILSSISLRKIHNKFIEFLFISPLGVSAITFTFAFLSFKIKYLNWCNPLFLLLIIHTILAFPMSYRIILRAVRSISDNVLNSSYIMGATPFYSLKKVIIPQIKNSLILSFVLSFSYSLGEIGASSILRKNYITIPVAIYRYINSYSFGKASVMGLFLMILTVVMVFILKKYKIKSI